MKSNILPAVRRIGTQLNTRLIKILLLGWAATSLTVLCAKNADATPVNELLDEVDALNRAVGIYLEWGGDLDDVQDVQQVIAKLQTVSDSNDIPKFKALLVDPRMAPVMQNPEEARAREPRVLWSEKGKRFYVSSSGQPGIRFFVFE